MCLVFLYSWHSFSNFFPLFQPPGHGWLLYGGDELGITGGDISTFWFCVLLSEIPLSGSFRRDGLRLSSTKRRQKRGRLGSIGTRTSPDWTQQGHHVSPHLSPLQEIGFFFLCQTTRPHAHPQTHFKDELVGWLGEYDGWLAWAVDFHLRRSRRSLRTHTQRKHTDGICLC